MQVDEEALQAAHAAQQKALEDCTTERCGRDHLREAIAGYLTALEARCYVIVPVSQQLEFARTREGEILVGYNPRSEDGGWIRVGNVTEAVSKIEAERDEALASLAKAKQRIAAIRIAAGDLSASKDGRG